MTSFLGIHRDSCKDDSGLSSQNGVERASIGAVTKVRRLFTYGLRSPILLGTVSEENRSRGSFILPGIFAEVPFSPKLSLRRENLSLKQSPKSHVCFGEVSEEKSPGRENSRGNGS
jgi:hypothetical protein